MHGTDNRCCVGMQHRLASLSTRTDRLTEDCATVPPHFITYLPVLLQKQAFFGGGCRDGVGIGIGTLHGLPYRFASWGRVIHP